MIDPDRRSALLAAARAALEAGAPVRQRIGGGPAAGSVSVFVTLRRGGELRGCIGVLEDQGPIETAVEHCALSASRDPRFSPLRRDELPDVRIEISVLGEWRPIEGPGEVAPGRDGLFVTRDLHRGLLLPQVAVEQEWGAEEFLEQTCMKAGLPPDAWKRGASVRAFTAEVFSEPEAGPEAGPSST